MTDSACFMLQFDAAEPKFIARLELVYIVAKTYSEVVHEVID
jgi:hypothetical protein